MPKCMSSCPNFLPPSGCYSVASHLRSDLELLLQFTACAGCASLAPALFLPPQKPESQMHPLDFKLSYLRGEWRWLMKCVWFALTELRPQVRPQATPMHPQRPQGLPVSPVRQSVRAVECAARSRANAYGRATAHLRAMHQGLRRCKLGMLARSTLAQRADCGASPRAWRVTGKPTTRIGKSAAARRRRGPSRAMGQRPSPLTMTREIHTRRLRHPMGP